MQQIGPRRGRGSFLGGGLFLFGGDSDGGGAGVAVLDLEIFGVEHGVVRLTP